MATINGLLLQSSPVLQASPVLQDQILGLLFLAPRWGYLYVSM